MFESILNGDSIGRFRMNATRPAGSTSARTRSGTAAAGRPGGDKDEACGEAGLDKIKGQPEVASTVGPIIVDASVGVKTQGPLVPGVMLDRCQI
jgi:hypothetical protein